MAITRIIPSPREVWMCDFSGYVKPEIVKLRRVVILSAPRAHGNLALVVPISTTAPDPLLPIHVHIPTPSYACFDQQEVWVKANLISHVSFERLDRVRIHGHYLRAEKLSHKHFANIRAAVKAALDLA